MPELELLEKVVHKGGGSGKRIPTSSSDQDVALWLRQPRFKS